MQYLLIVHLYEEGSLEDIITAMTSLGIENAVVVDGQRMSSLLAFDVPIFAGFREEMGGHSSYCKVLTATIDHPELVDGLLRVMKEADIDFIGEEMGTMFLLPLERYIGFNSDDS